MPTETTPPKRAAARAAARAAQAAPTVVRDHAPNTRPSTDTARVFAETGDPVAEGLAQFRHIRGCPVEADEVPEGADVPDRMEHYLAEIPLGQGGGVCTIVRCMECGEQVRVD